MKIFMKGTLEKEKRMVREYSSIHSQVKWVEGFPNIFKEDSYEGEFKKDLRTGYGKMIYSNGDIYEGEWLAD